MIASSGNLVHPACPENASRLLRHAAIQGDVEAVRQFLSWGADPNRFDRTDARDLPDSNPGKTALHYAAAHGRADVVAQLLAAGAKANGKRLHGDTPLMEWVRGRACHGHDPARDFHRAAVLLLQAGANPHLGMSSPVGSPWSAALQKGLLPSLIRAMQEAKAHGDARELHTCTRAPALDEVSTRRL